MHPIRRVVTPVQAVVQASRRAGTYSGHAKEAMAMALTMGAWPWGFGDAGADRLDGLDGETSVATPVLLVHGYGANKSNWLFIRRYLDQAGFGRVHALNYNPLSDDLPHLAERCAERADALRRQLDVPTVHIIGHSLGGIIARYAVQVLGTGGVGVCVSIASPHGGVRLARYGSHVAALSPLASGLALRPDSAVMTMLRSTARRLPTRFVAYYSNLDLIVPARRAMILEPELAATNILVKDHGHLSIMWSRQLAASVVDQLGAAEGLPGYGSPVRPLRDGPVGDEDPEPDEVLAG